MSVEKNKKNKKKNKKINFGLYFIIIGIASYMGVHMYNTINAYSIKTYILDIGEISTFVEKEGLIIRDEYQVFSPSYGFITDSLEEGERVKRSGVIAKIQNKQLKGDEQFRLQIVNRRINELRNNSIPRNPEREIAELDSRIDFIYVDIQNRIINGDNLYVISLKDELISLIERRNLLNGTSEISQMTIEQLEAEKSSLEQTINSDKYYIKSEKPGVISFYSDNQHEVFSKSNMKNLSVRNIKDFKDFNIIDLGDSVKQGDLFATIINNHRWFMACEVNENDIRNIERGRPIKMHIGEDVLIATLYDFHKGEDEKFIGFFEIEDENFDFTKQRKHRFKLEYGNFKGIKIPKNSVVDNDGVLGVFTINQVGVAIFKELGDVKGEDDSYLIINFNPDNLRSQNIINLYDEVIISPRNIRSGQRVR